MIEPDARVAVVGGGLLGLTLALRLAEGGCRVTVFEASELGGLASAWSIDTPFGPVAWDRYYHVTLASDAALRGLLTDLDLDAAIAWTDRRVTTSIDLGTHTLFVGEMLDGAIRDDEARSAAMSDTRMKYGGVKRH